MNKSEIERILVKFDELPKVTREPTYLEICKYPSRRFEEICSRILSFYFSPRKEHGFGSLFLTSLLTQFKSENLLFDERKVIVVNEENAEGKRIDILVRCPDFVIGIENKITANLYNALPIYGKRIDLYNSDKKRVFKAVLSLKKIKDEELQRAVVCGFTCITYRELFDAIKRNIGPYLLKASNKYLIYLTDFMQTLENMDEKSSLGNEVAEFFSENAQKVDSLIEMYCNYKEEMLSRQKQRVADLLIKIKEFTEDGSWWVYEGYDLGYRTSTSTSKHDIGVEAMYHTKDGNALGVFKVQISTWNLNDWAFYEPQLRTNPYFQDFKEEGNKRVIYTDNIYDDDENEILSKLKEHYEYVKKIATIESDISTS